METTTENKVITRAEKKDATKNLIREVLAIKGYKHNELIDEVAALYIQRFGGEEADKINDVKGRVGSVLDVMKKESDVGAEDGVYMLKARLPMPPPEVAEAEVKEKPAKKTRAKKTKTEPVPPAPLQPIAPVAPVSPETAPEPATEKPAKRKRAKKQTAETLEEVKEVKETAVAEEEKPKKKTTKRAVKKAENKDKDKEKKEERKDEPTVIPADEPVIVPTPVPVPVSEPTPPPQPITEPAPAPIAAPAPVFDMTALFGEIKTPVKAEKPVEKKEEKKAENKAEEKPEPKPEKTEKEGGRVELKEKAEVLTPTQKPVQKPLQKPEQKPVQKREEKQPVKERVTRAASSKQSKPLTAEEALKEAYLKKLRSLGGEYFEYYSIYLLEKYSRMNGRRLEGLRVSGGDQDGGIDGEIELTDKFGFRETIYIQAKNWNPDKGKEHLWIVGETLLQQFLGACVYRQAKEGKQHCRGIFITTSRFTPEAKRLLDELSDRLVGYDENDLFEAAKECSFGLVQRNGNWVLDEKLLSGEKAFFNIF
ncbi:MAG: restriction endonuclease [Clostridia bacterium]|nr:restriction endonuclease [Clostridia bacterium]